MASEANLEQARASLRALSINAENDDDDAPVLDEGADEDAVEDRELMDFDDEEDGGFVSEIMMSLDTEKVKALRTEFSRRVDGLELPEFCHVMKSCLLNMPGEGADADPHGAAPEGDNSKLKSMGDARLVAHFCELFEQVDVNGNGSLDWDEFTSHIVEMVMATHDHKPDIIQNYTPGIVKEVSKRRTSYIKELYYFEANDAIVTFDVDSPEFRVFSPRLEARMTVARPEGQVVCLDYMPVTSQYVVSTSDLMLSIYDEFSGVLVKSFRTQNLQVCVVWVDSHRILYTAESSGTIRAWDVEDMEERFSMIAPPPAFAGGGDNRSSVAESGDDGDGTRGDRPPRGSPEALAASSTAVEFSHSRIILTMLNLGGLEMLATASMDCMISLWDLQTGKHKRSLEGHSKGVCCLSYSPEYRFLVSGGFDFDVIVWNPYVEHLILRLPGHTNSICGVEIVADSPQLVTADVDGVIRVWDVRNFACVQTFTVEDRWKAGISRFVSVYPRKELLAVGRAIHTFQYQHLDNPELTDDTPVFAALYNSTTTTLLTASVKHVRIWDARNGHLMRVYRDLSGGDDELTAVAFDGDQRKLFVGDHSGHALSYNYLNGAFMANFEGEDGSDDERGDRGDRPPPPPRPTTEDLDIGEGDEVAHLSQFTRRAHFAEVSKVCYAKEHNVVITASWDRSVHVYDDTEEGDSVLLRRMTGGHDADITALCFSHNLSLIATGGSNGTIVIWDFEFGRLLGKCDKIISAITNLAFVDPYPALLSSDGSGTFHLWAVPPSDDRFRCLAAWNTDRAPGAAPRAAEADDDDDEKQKDGDESDGDDAPATSSSVLCFALATVGKDPGSPGRGARADFDDPGGPGGGAARVLIVSGDDKGSITLWDIAPLLKNLCDGGRFDFGPVREPVACVNERRNLRYDAAAVVRRSDPTLDDDDVAKRVRLPPVGGAPYEPPSEALGGLRAPAARPSALEAMAARLESQRRLEDDLVRASLRFANSYDLQAGVRRLRTFVAHGDSVLSVQYIGESSAILSSGLDRLVHLWSLDGDHVGTLRQGVKVRGRGPGDWKFLISDVAHKRRRVKRARDVLRTMHALEREQRAADEAARSAMPHAKRGGGAQLRAATDGQLHFVLNDHQMRDPEADDDDDYDAPPETHSRDGDPNNLDALADVSGFRPVSFVEAETPKRPPRPRRKPVGPAQAGRRLVPKQTRPKLR